MENFNESNVRRISIVSVLFILILGNINVIIVPFAIIPILVYFSTKGIIMFDNSVSMVVRVICWILCTAFILYMFYNSKGFISEKSKITLNVVGICVGVWAGDVFAKYVYVRLKLLFSRFSKVGEHKYYKVVNLETDVKQYVKKIGVKKKVHHYYINLDIDGKIVKMYVDGDYVNKIKNKKELKLTVNKGLFNNYFATDLEASR